MSNTSSRDFRKIKSKRKRELRQLSFPQLLLLANKYDSDKHTYEYEIINFLVEKDWNMVNDSVNRINEMKTEIDETEFILNKLPHSKLIEIIRTVKPKYNPEFKKDRVIKDIFRYINYKTIQDKIQHIKCEFKQIAKDQAVKERLERERIEKKEKNKKEFILKNKSLEKIRKPKPHIIKKETNQNTTPYDYKIDLKKYDKDIIFKIFVEHKDLFDEFKNISKEEIINLKDEFKSKKEELIDEILSKTSIKELEKNIINPRVRENFYYNNPRLYQLETITEVYNAIENGYKYIIIEAPAGFGKSVIATTLANIYSNEQTYILTTSNQLVSQYNKIFTDYTFFNTKSRSATQCKVRGNCSISNCNPDNCVYHYDIEDINLDLPDKYCNYEYQIAKAKTHNIVICNYNYFILENFYQSNDFKQRKLLICDEGHNVDDFIAKGTSLRLYPHKLEKIGLNVEDEKLELEENKDYYYTFIKKVEFAYENYLKQNKNKNKNKKYKLDLDNIKKFLTYFEEYTTNLAYVVDDSSRYIKWIFKPIQVKNLTEDALFKFGDVCIFMSSSIFNHSNFAYDLDIDEDEIYSITVPNIFDLSKNPIKIYEEFNLSYENLVENSKYTIQVIKEILNEHRNEKGIIHTHSYDCSNYIYNKLSQSPRVINHNKYDKETKLVEYKNNAFKVLISPAMSEGLDLPEEECRFQIIYKLPFPPLDDERINERKNTFEDGEKWYVYKMITNLIQMHGRGIRSEEDYCKTYVLDNRLWDIIDEDLENENILPESFLNVIEGLDINKIKK